MRAWLLPLLSVGCVAFAVMHVVRAQHNPAPPPPPVDPSRSPYATRLAGAGLIEPMTENIAVGTHLPGVVQEVFVKVGQPVKKGDPLFRLDERQLQAERKVRQAALAAATAKLKKLEDMPRPEELPSAQARVREADANLANEQDQLMRAQPLYDRRAISEEELIRRRQMFRMAKEQLSRVQAEYDLLKAGAWAPDKAVASADVAQARAQLDQTQTELERLVVRASVDGEVLQVNVRPGEFVAAQPGPLVMLGNVHRLHLRVDISEHDLFRFQSDAPAQASPRGHAQHQIPLTFVRVEPFVVPKKSLTGVSTERVDTRVLQVIYALGESASRLYVGQQMDVYIDAKK